MQAAHDNDSLVRKQFLVSVNNVKKLEELAKEKKTSAAEIVRLAIDAYDPHRAGNMEAEELMELVSSRLKDAIDSTIRSNQKVNNTLKKLDILEKENQVNG